MRVPVHDADGGRLIYFAAPLRWSEAIWSDWLATTARPLSDLFVEGIGLPVVKTTTEFLRPVRQDQVIDLELSVVRLGTTSITLRTEVRDADGALCVHVETVHVFVTGLHDAPSPASTPLPGWLRRPLEDRPPLQVAGA